MTPELIIPLLFLIGLVLLVGEVLLPTHGLLGALGLIAIVGGIGYAFRFNTMLGVGLLTGTVLASPFAFALAMKVYPHTPIGKRMILNATMGAPRELVRLSIGDVGRAVSDLRPAGQCQFSTGEYEAHSEGPMIHASSVVKVVNIESGRITVRAV
jgi:membrane-bound ClpP family serine protease